MHDEFLFVYGTLRRAIGHAMHQVLVRHCEYVDDGWIQGQLYQIAHYPGAIATDDPHDRVHGEVYRIIHAEQVLPVLDDYEECAQTHPQPHEYLRRQLPVSLAQTGEVSAWVYLYNRDVAPLTRIDSGDFLAGGPGDPDPGPR
ncbi:MAG: gamma-glutamylcyclotransferase [Gammaproteobacteria bacterium]|nr:gamma-glutamylcyclotransferase [Gammaproteobacteria bacterium]